MPSDAPQSPKILSSEWGGLSQHLIARFYPMKRLDSGKWGQATGTEAVAEGFVVDNGFEVRAPITDCNLELSGNWSSPFENAGTESKAPALAAMLQSGSLVETANTILAKVGLSGTSAPDFLKNATGRTGITKLNSTQIFTGEPPAKIQMTAHFRAFKDPAKEVRRPIQQLSEWFAPQHLADEGIVTGAIKGGKSPIETLYPSKTPQLIGFTFGDMALGPMVISSISQPITSPRSADGVITACSIQITIESLRAWDRRDIQGLYK